VVEIFLEERVVGFDDRESQPACEAPSHAMRHKRRLHVDQVECSLLPERGTLELAGDRNAVLRVEREISRADPDDARLVVPRLRIAWRHEDTVAALGLEVVPESLYRG
jgi:hypothetical protein